jgi:hypothetical protein
MPWFTFRRTNAGSHMFSERIFVEEADVEAMFETVMQHALKLYCRKDSRWARRTIDIRQLRFTCDMPWCEADAVRPLRRFAFRSPNMSSTCGSTTTLKLCQRCHDFATGKLEDRLAKLERAILTTP